MCLFDCVPFVLFRYQNICFTPNNSDLTDKGFPDTSNIVQSSFTSNTEYTFDDNVFIMGKIDTVANTSAHSGANIYLNDVIVAQCQARNQYSVTVPVYIPVKKGDIFKIVAVNSGTWNIKAFKAF